MAHIDASEAMLLLEPVRQQICFCFPPRHSGYRECLIIASLMALNDTSVPTVTFRSTSVVNKVISKQLLCSLFRVDYIGTLRNRERRGRRQANMHAQTHLQLSKSPLIWPLHDGLHIRPNLYICTVTHQWMKRGQVSNFQHKIVHFFHSRSHIFQNTTYCHLLTLGALTYFYISGSKHILPLKTKLCLPATPLQRGCVCGL